MSAKQDKTYARTAQDLERKYQFGKTFADMLGLINDNRDKVDEVESSVTDKINEQYTTLKRDATQISAEAVQALETKLEDGSLKEIRENAKLLVTSSDFVVEIGRIEETTDGLGERIGEVEKDVALKVDADSVGITIEQKISEGVDRVVTKTGYEFGVDGLDISKSGEEMANRINHEGMVIKRNTGDEILVANSTGVEATNLHAKTHLIIGSRDGICRFEEYDTNRMGCFFTGG